MTSRPARTVLLVSAVVAYGLVVAVLAAFYTFPYEPAGRLARSIIEASAPLGLTFDPPRPIRPFRVAVPRLSVQVIAADGALTFLDEGDLTLTLSPWSMIRGKPAGHFSLGAYGGRIQGRFGPTESGAEGFRLGDVSLDLPGFDWTGPETLGRVTGRLHGSLEASGPLSAFPSAGKGVLSLGPGRVEGLKLPGIPLNQMDFERMDLEFTLDPEGIRIDKLEGTGSFGRLHMTGRITAGRNAAWALNGTATVGPTRGHLTVSGPLMRPEVRIAGVSLNPAAIGPKP